HRAPQGGLPGGEMGWLEGQHLVALGEYRLDFGEGGATAGGDHQLGGFVGEDAAVFAGIKLPATTGIAVKPLGIAAANPQRQTAVGGGADALRPALDNAGHSEP